MFFYPNNNSGFSIATGGGGSMFGYDEYGNGTSSAKSAPTRGNSSATIRAAALKKLKASKTKTKKKTYVLRRIGEVGVVGGVGATSPTGTPRRVTVTGTASYNKGGLRTESGLESELKADFEAQGWTVHNLNLTLDGYLSGTAGIVIEADVSNDFANQSHLDQAARIFNNYTLNVGFGGGNVFTNIILGITGAEKPRYKAPNTQTIRATPTPTPTPGGDQNASNAPNNNGGGIDLLSLLGIGAGVSATTAVIVGGAFLLIMLKK